MRNEHTASNMLYVKMSFPNQPIELVIQQLNYLPVREILNLCETNTEIAAICDRRDFWTTLLIRDFPDTYKLYGPRYPNMRNLYKRAFEKREQTARKIQREQAASEIQQLDKQLIRMHALHLSIPDLLGKCQTSYQYAEVCEDNYFWAERLQQDFPNLSFYLDQDLRELYMSYYLN